MKTLFLVLTMLTFASVRATATADPKATAGAVTALAHEVDPCCPEWLCRLLCGWWCQPGASPACQPHSCCASSCSN